MATKLEEARQKREQAYVAVKELRDKFTSQGDKWADEAQRSAWTKANADYDGACKEIESLQDSELVLKRFAELEEARERREVESRRHSGGTGAPGREDSGEVTEETRAMAFQAWCRHQMGKDLSPAHIEACKRTGMNVGRRELEIDLGGTSQFRSLRQQLCSVHPSRMNQVKLEGRALAKGTPSAGGYTVPEGFMLNLEKAMLAYGGVRQVAQVIRTEGGEDMPWPTANDTSNSGAMLAENNQAASNVDPSFGVKTFGAYKMTSRIVLVPHELLEDSAFDLASELALMLGERLGRIQNTYATTGTGSGQPGGIVTGSTLGKAAAATNAITPNELIELQHSVNPAYRTNAGFMMHDNIVLALRLLKDQEGVYVWRSGLADNRPDTLLGQPLTINQDMASAMTADAKTILYGDFSKMKIREVRSIRLYRLQERYRDYDQEGFVAFLRFDSGVVNAGTNPIKHLIQDDGA